MNKFCLTCNSSFYARPSEIKKGNNKFCSRKCWTKSRMGIISSKKGITHKIKLECALCSKIFEVWPSRLKRGNTQFCSVKCARMIRIRHKSPSWKGGIKKEKYTGYVLLFKPQHPNSDSTRYIERTGFLIPDYLQCQLTRK